MMLRIIHGKLKPGTWDSYERAYKDVMAKAGKIPGLRGRWLAHASDDADAGYTMSLWENEAAMRAYESSDILQRQSCRNSKLSSPAITRQRAAKSGSLKSSIKRRVTCQSSSGFPIGCVRHRDLRPARTAQARSTGHLARRMPRNSCLLVRPHQGTVRSAGAPVVGIRGRSRGLAQRPCGPHPTVSRNKRPSRKARLLELGRPRHRSETWHFWLPRRPPRRE